MADSEDQGKPDGATNPPVSSALLATFVMQLGIEQSILNAIVVNLANRSLVGSNLVEALRGSTPPGLVGDMRDKYGELLRSRLNTLATLIERYDRGEDGRSN